MAEQGPTTPPPVDVEVDEEVSLWQLLSPETLSPEQADKYRAQVGALLRTSEEKSDKFVRDESVAPASPQDESLQKFTMAITTATKMSKWVSKGKARAAKSLYAQIRQDYLDALEHGAVAVELSKEEKAKVKAQRQADADMNSPEMIEKRMQIKKNAALDLVLLKGYERLPQHHKQVYRGVYKALCAGMYKHLVPGGYAEQFEAMFDDDWEADAKGQEHLGFEMFREAMVTLTDIWCPTANLKDYEKFLNQILVPSIRFTKGVDPLADDFNAGLVLRCKKPRANVIGLQPCMKKATEELKHKQIKEKIDEKHQEALRKKGK